MKPRFQSLGVENQGRRVAVIYDRKHCKEVRVFKDGRNFFHWGVREDRVVDPKLRKVAREALEGAGA